MPDIPTFDEYVSSLGRLTAHIDPTAASPNAAEIKQAATSLEALDEITEATLTAWAAEHPSWVNVLGLTVGLSQEKLKNTLKHRFDTSGWVYVDDIAGHYDRAEGGGAVIVTELASPWGLPFYVAEDLEGNRWTFVQARPTMR